MKNNFFKEKYIMPVSFTNFFRPPSNSSVATFCFYIGLIALAIGLYVWLKKKPEIFPGYKENEIRDPAQYAKLRGQSLISLGTALIVLSFTINSEDPDTRILVATLLFTVFLLLTALYLHLQAHRLGRK